MDHKPNTNTNHAEIRPMLKLMRTCTTIFKANSTKDSSLRKNVHYMMGQYISTGMQLIKRKR